MGVDSARYLKLAAAARHDSFCPAWELEFLGQIAQKLVGLPAYTPPWLLGTGGAGATLAYAALAESPPHTFAGAASAGFCPLLATVKEVCRGDGLRWEKRPEGYRLLPSRKLEDPWLELVPAAAPACPGGGAAGFAAQTANALRIPPPAGTKKPPEELFKEQLAQAQARLGGEQRKRAAARFERPAELADLPLVEMPAAAGPATGILAVEVTGSGGFEGFDVDLARGFARRGVPVVALSSLDYFWSRRDPAGVARDLARILDHYLKAWHKDRALLVGYSQGADILPFMVDRLPPALRSRVAVVGLVGPDPNADFEMDVSFWQPGKKPAPPLPVAAEIARLKGSKVLCVRGEHERKSLCPRLEAGLVETFTVPGGHDFSGSVPEMIDRFFAMAGVAAKAKGPHPR